MMSIRHTLMPFPKLLLLAAAISLATASAGAGQTPRGKAHATAKTTQPAKRIARHARRPAPVVHASRRFATEPQKPVIAPDRFEDRGGGGGGGGGM